MTAEAIARVVSDLLAGKVRSATKDPAIDAHALSRVDNPTVVDTTAIYRSLADNPRPVYLYEDHPSIAPPWPVVAYGYVNEHGNAVVMTSHAEERDSSDAAWADTPHPVDWDRVRWIIDSFVWLGGRSPTFSGAMPTMGPVHLWRFAVYADGEPADMRWVHLVPDYPMEHWDMAHLVLLGALNFLNCSNVDAVKPSRPRAQARRLARLGVSVHELVVRPRTRSASVSLPGGPGVPLTTVRGSFHHYGPRYGKGLLFGKLEGRYWVPAHARGGRSAGETHASSRLDPEPR